MGVKKVAQRVVCLVARKVDPMGKNLVEWKVCCLAAMKVEKKVVKMVAMWAASMDDCWAVKTVCHWVVLMVVRLAVWKDDWLVVWKVCARRDEKKVVKMDARMAARKDGCWVV